MSAPEPHPGFPIDDPAAVVADLRGRLDALASRMVDVGQATLGRDPVVMALVDHQRHKPDKCLCGWGDLGKSHAEHVAGIIRPLIEAEVRATPEPLPVINHKGPHDTDASMFEAMARRLDAGFEPGGFNCTDALVRLIRREVARSKA